MTARPTTERTIPVPEAAATGGSRRALPRALATVLADGAFPKGDGTARPLPSLVPEEVAACPIADWEGREVHATVEGSPDFVTPAWFHQNAFLSPTAVRRIRDAVRRRRRADPSFLAWWPSEAEMTASNAFWFLARAAVHPRDSNALCRLIQSECRASPFSRLVQRWHDGGPGERSALGPGFVFAQVYSLGVDGFRHVLKSFIVDGAELTEVERGLLDWCLERHPEAYEELDRAMAGRPVAARAPTGPTPRKATSAPTFEPEDPGIASLLERLAVADGTLAASEEERATVEAERDALQDDLNDLNSRYAALQRELAAVRAGHDPRQKETPSAVEALPTTLPELLAWIETALPPTVHVTPRAWRGIKKAVSVDFERVAKGLRFLRDTYVPYRSDSGITEERYKAAMVESGFEECASFASASSLKAFPEYEMIWNGRKVHLDRHLKRGYSNNPRDCLRIYFLWDRATGTVVVGSMPGHLTNWLS